MGIDPAGEPQRFRGFLVSKGFNVPFGSPGTETLCPANAGGGTVISRAFVFSLIIA
jgi:hypothetical protein